MAINRMSLREQVRHEILRRVRGGAFTAGESINEARLSAELGVSRTPLREALIGLEAEGSIASDVGRGFRVASTTQQEFGELTAIVTALECLALESTPAEAWREIAPELRRRAEAFSASVADHQELAQRDEEWHSLMTSGCPNQRLLALISSLKASLYLYEFEVVPSHAMVDRAASEHVTIASWLEAGDIVRAQTALRANWSGGLQRIVSRSPVAD